MSHSSQDGRCRRRALRFPLPLEVELHHNGQTIRAIIRDASIEDERQDRMFGVGLLHDDQLPLHETLDCRTISDCPQLNADAQLTLTWSRSFGTDGYLSGGRMVCEVDKAAVAAARNENSNGRGTAVHSSDD